jgi:putative ABC transport system permease protein
MFLQLVADSFTRRPRRKLLTLAALALGMAVVTAALSVSLDVGDRLAREFRSLGANLLVTPEADSLPLQIGGVDYRPANAGAYLPESDLGKLKTIFWRFNIIGFAPVLDVPVRVSLTPAAASADTTFIGTWSEHAVPVPDGSTFTTGVQKTNPWWHVEGKWFADNAEECLIGSGRAQKMNLKVGDTVNIATDNAASAKSLRVVGIVTTGGPEDSGIVGPLNIAQALSTKDAQYRQLYVSALTKPEDAFARRDPKSMTPADYDKWYCSPYVSSIALQISQVLKGADVHVIRRVADGEGRILTRVRTLLWLVTIAALLAAALAVGASAAASVIERRAEIGLMKALGADSALVGILLAAEQMLIAFVGGSVGYCIGIMLARLLGERIFGYAPEPRFFVLIVVLGVAALITLIGSVFPLRRAARYEPAPILRGE